MEKLEVRPMTALHTGQEAPFGLIQIIQRELLHLLKNTPDVLCAIAHLIKDPNTPISSTLLVEIRRKTDYHFLLRNRSDVDTVSAITQKPESDSFKLAIIRAMIVTNDHDDITLLNPITGKPIPIK